MNKMIFIQDINNYEHEKHQEMVQSWLRDWNMDPQVTQYFPEYGLIIPDVCCLFLYETNSKTCFLEGFLSNKHQDKAKVNEGLDLIGDVLIKQAQEKGYKLIAGYTQRPVVADRTIKHGFQVSNKPYYFFSKLLNGDK